MFRRFSGAQGDASEFSPRVRLKPTPLPCNSTGHNNIHPPSCSLACRVRKNTPNALNKFVHRLYDQCAAFNLRHCSFNGFMSGNKNYFNNFLKDFWLLCCFLVANSLVFLVLLTRMCLQMVLALVQCFKWMQRNMPKISLDEAQQLKYEIKEFFANKPLRLS